MKRVIVIGGGIIGLCSAYYLRKEGHEVIVIDKSKMNGGASYVNAGYITPSHIIPLSAPGMITKGLKWMLNPSSPFYVKPRMDMEFLKWGWAFKKSAKKEKVNRAIPIIKDINLFSRELYEEMKTSDEFNFHYERNGLLMLCKTEKALEEEWEVGKKAISTGLNVVELNKEQTQKYEPDIDLDIIGSVYFDCDAHMTPSEFMGNMKAYLEKIGVQFCLEEEVKDIEVSEGKISEVITSKQKISCEEVVLAAGAWSPMLVKKLGLKIPIQAGKGYRINVERTTGIKTPAILVEAKVAVTPMSGFTRFAGTMEIGSINHKISPVRVNAIAQAASQYYSGVEITQEEKENAACGLRPCTPDGLPFIGRSSKCDNLTVATGHAMMGWSLGPATGKLVSEIISEKKLSMPIDAFHPDRSY
ncbi:FAD-dependent oxidoreductase [Aureisphaera galaxeae]|uniref:NAD(P)/FAD-dependent oxidoreductase n=1 Tax=Aureisphaera galaxeae TaxID=1538023 RepID=UPI00235001B3|nr:FAD-dependent oxidoreductase [Aureisphaera galaxeae]MDC8002887.1 FAD-dependent oxidoreductase [Aureisphaera galaxeae]